MNINRNLAESSLILATLLPPPTIVSLPLVRSQLGRETGVGGGGRVIDRNFDISVQTMLGSIG